MDIKHRAIWMRLKLFGQRDPIEIQAPSISMALRQLAIEFDRAATRYGPGQIEFSFEPLDRELTSSEKAYQSILAGIDMSQVEFESEEDAANPRHWNLNPMNVDSPNYDTLYHEYQNCTSPAHRATKTPEDLSILRRHMDTHYSDSIWWDRSHRW